MIDTASKKKRLDRRVCCPFSTGESAAHSRNPSVAPNLPRLFTLKPCVPRRLSPASTRPALPCCLREGGAVALAIMRAPGAFGRRGRIGDEHSNPVDHSNPHVRRVLKPAGCHPAAPPLRRSRPHPPCPSVSTEGARGVRGERQRRFGGDGKQAGRTSFGVCDWLTRCPSNRKRTEFIWTPWRWQKAFMSLLSGVVILHLK